jgi:hypothetical protein
MAWNMPTHSSLQMGAVLLWSLDGKIGWRDNVTASQVVYQARVR